MAVEPARPAQPLPIVDIARSQGLSEDDLELYGKYIAKVRIDAFGKLQGRPKGKYIVVTSITPTPLGEGKTTTSIGLAMGMNRLGYHTAVCLRQASLGPLVGVKGGAAGGGGARLIPFERVNFHLTGDSHAVASSHNLLAAFVDNSLFHSNPCHIDPYTITWKRVIDMNDRALRRIITGLGGKENGVPRESGFDLVANSEVMAALALVNAESDCSAVGDLHQKLGRIVVAASRSAEPVNADALRATGVMTALLDEAVKPNLVQTVENTPAFVHTGPVGNLAHGCSSILADKLALALNDYVVTEAGFGSDLGMEKFFDIKCRISGLMPNAIVLVATVRALKMHGGAGKVVAGRPLPEELEREDLNALERGLGNLVKHLENARLFGLPVVVALNHFESDTEREIALVERIARESGAEGVYLSDAFTKGGSGVISLAEAVVHACRKPSRYKALYQDDLPIEDKIDRIATQVYGAAGVDFSPAARAKLKLFGEQGYGRLPVCMAKTHLSLSDDAKLKGRPRGFRVAVRDLHPALGAGFIIVYCGEISTMPGLPSEPAGSAVKIDSEGRIVGLY